MEEKRSPSRRTGVGWSDRPPFPESTTRILVAGDWHGTLAWGLRVLTAAKDSGAQAVVVCGDHQMLWPGDKQSARKLDRRAQQLDLDLVLIPGNHDWHPKLDSLPLAANGLARIEERIWHAPKGSRWEANGISFAALGGAHSVDRAARTPGKSWWPQELISEDDLIKLGSAPVDVLFTHESPIDDHLRSSLQLSPKNKEMSAQQRDLVRKAVENTSPKVLFHGHWHQRSSSQLRHPHGLTTVIGLDMQWTPGNWILLDIPSLKILDPR